jgi:hypothetical protein
MKKRLLLRVERLRDLTPRQLQRALGGLPNNGSLDEACDTVNTLADTVTQTNMTMDTMTNVFTNGTLNTTNGNTNGNTLNTTITNIS